MIQARTYKVLAYSGAIPFVACALATVFAVPVPTDLVERIAVSYGLAIVSFLAGAHWGLYLHHGEAIRLNLLVSSNLILLAVWFFSLFASVRWALLSQAVAFVVLLAIDYRLAGARAISRQYFALRGSVTLLVIGAIGVMVVFR